MTYKRVVGTGIAGAMFGCCETMDVYTITSLILLLSVLGMSLIGGIASINEGIEGLLSEAEGRG